MTQEDRKALRDQIEILRGRDTGLVPSLDELLDDEARRRFGQAIARAVHKATVRETLANVAVTR
jgi:hypothetical protein